MSATQGARLGRWKDDRTGPRVIKRNVRDSYIAGPKQKPLALPRLRTGKQYTYEGKR